MATRVSRRRAIKAAVASGAVAVIAGALGLVRTGGYEIVRPGGSLEPWQLAVVRHLARRICAPDDPSVVTPDAVDVAGFVDAYAANMPGKLRRDLDRFLGFIEQLAPIACGCSSRFTRLAPGEQDRVLARLEASPIELVRGGFDALRALLFMGYYRDPRTWSVLGYDGPWVPPRAPGGR